MNTKALKQKILDLAIHGKLLSLEKVEQIRKDEPASILLEKIRAEKQEKIAKGELKKDKNDSFIFVGDDKRHYEKFVDGSVKDIEDEIPFDVPEGWSWCRLGEITSEILYGVNESAKEKGDYRLLRITDIQNDSVNWYSVPFTNYPKEKVNNYLLQNNDIVFARTGATVGKSFLIENLVEPAIYASYLIRIRILFSPKYIKTFFGSPCYWNQITDKSSGIGQPNVNGTSLANLFIPLPPLTEQKLIVEEIEKIFAQIDLLEQNKTDLQTAIKQAKSKILDLAIHGKLVPQDPNDEPASVLLEKIRAEKEEKIAKGEIKRDKNDSYIYKSTTDNCHYQKNSDGSIVNIEDEIPFEVPEGWSWCRLGEICELYDGEKINKKLPYLDAKHFRKKGTDYVDFGKFVKANSYLILVDGENSGEIFFNTIDGIQGSTFKILNIQESICKNFILHFIRKNQLLLRNSKVGSAIPHLNKKLFKELFLPLPPLAEQQRIVSKIEEIFAILDRINSELGADI